jgi:CubicO group peptidase (beta-lactamase class C family)
LLALKRAVSLGSVRTLFRCFTLVSLFVAVGLFNPLAVAQGPAPTPLFSPGPVLPPAPPLPELALAHELTRPDLEAFLDALIPAQLQNRDIAGAVVSVVKDSRVLLAKGYGYADFAAKKPVVAEKTLFRPGSISKVFTAIAVMQLV